MVNRWHILFWLWFFSIFMVGSAMAVSIQAVADRDRITVGESLQLELRVDGHPDAEPDLSSLQKDWDILSRSQSSQMQIVNGNFSRSTVYHLTLMPKKQGTVTIPAVCFGSDCTIPLPINVATSASPGNGSAAALLLETEVSPEKIVTQGQLILRVRLLRRLELLDGQLSEPQPSGIAAVVKKLGDDRSYETRRNGLLYKVIERDYAIFPQGSGILTIPALQFDGTIANGTSRFDPFGRQGQRVRRTSSPLRVEVEPPPADLDSRPWIPATALILQDSWQQKLPQFVVGEPATRTLKLRATGVPAAQLPELQLALPDQFKSYPDQPNRTDQLTNDGIVGILEQKIALVPTQPGHYQLPAVELDWWDIAAGKWRHIHLAALPVDVAPAANSGTGNNPVPTKKNPDVLIPPLKKGASSSAKAPPGTIPVVAQQESFWPWLSLSLAIGWLLSVLVLLRRRRPPVVTVSKKPVDQLDEKTARQEVLHAARKHDSAATRQALRQWSRTLYPGLGAGAYEQFYALADSTLQQELSILDRSLYGNSEELWRGEALAEMIAAWQGEKNKTASPALPDLYP